MIVCSVLESFLSATRGNSDCKKDEEGQGSASSSGGVQYHNPSMENGILAPDACFNYH